jgi:hypothetical protein
MKPEELATFDAGLYDPVNPVDLRKSPMEADWISRDSRLTSNLAAAEDIVAPEDHLRATEIDHAIELIGTLPLRCDNCGQYIPKGTHRLVSLEYLEDDTPLRGSARCRNCLQASGINRDTDNWLAMLPALEQKIWRLSQEGFTQKQIAGRLTNGSQRVTQQKVSEVKRKIIRHFQRVRQNQYGSR